MNELDTNFQEYIREFIDDFLQEFLQDQIENFAGLGFNPEGLGGEESEDLDLDLDLDVEGEDIDVDDLDGGSGGEGGNIDVDDLDVNDGSLTGAPAGGLPNTESPKIILDDFQGVSIVNEDPTISVIWDNAAQEATAAAGQGPTASAY